MKQREHRSIRRRYLLGCFSLLVGASPSAPVAYAATPQKNVVPFERRSDGLEQERKVFKQATHPLAKGLHVEITAVDHTGAELFRENYRYDSPVGVRLQSKFGFSEFYLIPNLKTKGLSGQAVARSYQAIRRHCAKSPGFPVKPPTKKRDAASDFEYSITHYYVSEYRPKQTMALSLFDYSGCRTVTATFVIKGSFLQ